MEQQPGLQRLSAIINAPTIAGFLAGDPEHVAIFDTLLDLPITGVDSEIRTEFENGTVVRFPVLTLCLEGLERLLDKHETAKQMLQEKINIEGGQPGVYGKLIQNLPIARTGFLSAGPASYELDSINKNLEAAYNDKVEKLKAAHSQELADVREAADIEAAEELSKYKKDAYNEAKKAAAVAMAAEFERLNVAREQEATRLKDKAKQDIVRIRAETMAKCTGALEIQQKQHNTNYKERLKLNANAFQLFQDKWYIEVKLENHSHARIPYPTAAKLISENTKMFKQYKDLCMKALKKYKRELKENYRAHLHDIELECRQWLKDNASGRLGAEEASDGLKQTLDRGTGWEPATVLTSGRKDSIENPSIHMALDELVEEASEIMAEYQALQQKDVSEGGLGLQPVEFQNTVIEAAMQEADSDMNAEMQTVLDTLDGLVAKSIFSGTPLKAIQEKIAITELRMFSGKVVQPEPQGEVNHSQMIRNGVEQSKLQADVDPYRTSRNGVEQPELQAEADPRQMASNDVVHPELQVNRLEMVEYGFEQPELQPFQSPPTNARTRMLQRVFHGKTVTEIFEILGKRKRDAGNVGDENMPLSKRTNQQEH